MRQIITNEKEFSDWFELNYKKFGFEKILKKNRRFGQQNGNTEDQTTSYMSQSDIDFVQSHLMSTVANQTKFLEKNLYF